MYMLHGEWDTLFRALGRVWPSANEVQRTPLDAVDIRNGREMCRARGARSG